MIKVCVACAYGIHKDLVLSLEELKKSVELEVQIGRSMYPDRLRNMLIDPTPSKAIHRTLDPKYSHYLILDQAVAFSSEVIQEMMQADIDIIGMAVPHPDRSNSYTAGSWYKGQLGVTGDLLPLGIPSGLHSVKWIADHGILAKREALEAMMYPWFHGECVYGIDGEEGTVIVSDPSVGFSLRAEAANLDVYAYVPKGFSVKYYWMTQGVSEPTTDPKIEYPQGETGTQQAVGTQQEAASTTS